ncbi:hypothetical protein A3D80_01070 [Candidatus Roizmanbacteria bacterium RIFCSPHIGHO2_02_FULL_40_13b]|uniref:Glycosyltransferase RgtA/B/C/D-like domain-containing protein n=1 Tax=Candidatus Roizmanbacteria bacterium RIFCSPHIGHO2_01_FULL_39_24 TaxID=1802032 RepID=A0A1F7GMG4_9BACT|nr:MAG: hypothetical protein A2799_02725 [Candidatus Roizmanbacteria bacterium RIFCSPHIGHO2_01_FULL_39_24]OGK26287.1 MAG: hypothetical protein A3D80_01070 [Candidatus Roizmanbacteria bacterium RIFCSPHIGHO2_02_FULL_40_13b]OGK49350.1 MAG: hypothetical protein A3A56_03700 [Candidatus Roizmanbacteria bacterium RIFCSPLOWO2_01_FULL_40_32]
MSIKRLHNWKIPAIFAFVFILFVYFRVKPIYYQTVPYTYDQGRDFLKAEEIVRFHNPTFIGPTTGIQGVNHGVWWYYFLAMQYFIFNGNPSGFYYGVLAMMFISTLLFTIFLKKEFGNHIALLFLLIVTISPYFIGISFFAANNILAPPFVLLFIFSIYKFLQISTSFNKSPLISMSLYKYLFLIGLSLGFIFEAEMPLGLFIIPSFFVASILFKEVRSSFRKLNNLFFLILGLVLPFTFRILFEIKHNFIQTKSIIYFFKHPSATNAQGLDGILRERALLFLSYFQEIFYDNNKIIVFGAILVLGGIFICGYKRFEKLHRRLFLFFSSMILFIFLFSLSYRNNFFWDYYLEGIHYIFLFYILLLFYISTIIDTKKRLLTVILVLFSILAIFYLGKELTKQNNTPYIGLRADIKTVETVYSLVGKNDFCARIYTPPVVPYTYNYLFHYKSLQGYKVPLENPMNTMCIIIIDSDQYTFRIDEWRKTNIPVDFILEKKIVLPNNVRVEVWKQK